MLSSNGHTRLLRSARFETFEQRLMLTAQPLDDLGDDLLPAERAELILDEIETLLADVHRTTGADQVRDTYGFDGDRQTVAVIDTGVAYDHYALGGGFGEGYRVVGGWDFTEENDADPYDDGPAGFHGTHVAGVIGSSDATYTGVAPGVDIVALRVFNDQGSGVLSWVEDALQWVHDNRDAFDNPITTVNLSLGTQWNADTVPNWAMLEDEFAQLEADGIFIAVAAGNDFADYGVTGLSYPAASPFVVPVASTDNAGTMSDFSQRNSRVIAAPGEAITSTVPDYLFGFDGVTNDWATASGTSMAAPYVAGASVLMREAMQLLGYEDVTQDTIYDHFRSTADMVYDAVTGLSYHRLNLQRAIDAIMPQDDFGSTAAAAHSLGTMQGAGQLDGLIGTLDDRDFFTFTAGQTGWVSFAAQGTGQLDVDWRLEGGGGTIDAAALTFEVVAGQQYTVSLGTGDGLGFYQIDTELTPSIVDLGAVDHQRLTGQAATANGLWYELSATHTGLLTVQATFAHAAGNVDVLLYDAAGNLLASSSTSADTERVDFEVTAGETFRIQLVGGNDDVAVELVNLLSVQDQQVVAHGTAGNDTFTFRAGATHRVQIGGVVYQFDAAVVSSFEFHGGGGEDRLNLVGTAGDETVHLHVGHGTMTGAAFTATGEMFERIYAYSAGGADTAHLYDSAGDDRFFAKPDRAALWGDEFYNYAAGFDRVYAYATLGGNDYSHFYDSSGNDRFRSYPDRAVLWGNGFYNYAAGFDRVYAYSTAGGQDNAYAHDSTADDRFLSWSTRSVLLGAGFYCDVRGFDRVNAYASQGHDTAKLYDSAGDDRFYGYSNRSALRGDGFFNYVAGFDAVDAFAQLGGRDRAYLFDSAGDDRFEAAHDRALLAGDGFANGAYGFRYVYAYSRSGGSDQAVLYDSAGNDWFLASAARSLMHGNGFFNYARGFQTVEARAGHGGDDEAVYEAVGANDALFGRDDFALWTHQGRTHHAVGFRSVDARSEHGMPLEMADIVAVDYLFTLAGN